MAKFKIQITKEIAASYEVEITATDESSVVEQLEDEKLRSFEYEGSLKLKWDFGAFAPEISSVELIPSDEED